MRRFRPLLAALRLPFAALWWLLGGIAHLAGRVWRGARPHVVTAVAAGLLSYGAAQIYVPAGWITAAVCLVVLERKVELGR